MNKYGDIRSLVGHPLSALSGHQHVALSIQVAVSSQCSSGNICEVLIFANLE